MSAPNAISVSPYVVTVAMSLPITMSEFDEGKKASFKSSIAEAAGVSIADVIIDRIQHITTARSRAGISAARCLLALGIRIHMHLQAADKNTADILGAKLTVTAINAKLQQAGLPSATILEAPQTATSGDGGSTNAAQEDEGGAGVGNMLPAIIGAGVGFVILLAIAFCFYRWYSKTKTEPMTSPAMLDVASAELGLGPVQTRPDIVAHLGSSSTPTPIISCNDCGATNEVSSKFCGDCHMRLHHKDEGGILGQVVIFDIAYFVLDRYGILEDPWNFLYNFLNTAHCRRKTPCKHQIVSKMEYDCLD